ncbi:MAG: hypothetical protein JEY91_16105, partial [Spirochaetaceae bacterium]|nr:hypothetical protein [Spirochaetaceae bacterium]
MAEIIQKKSVEFSKKKKRLSIPLITTISSFALCVFMFSFFGNFDIIFNEDNYLNYKTGDVVKDDVYSNSEVYLIDEVNTEKKKELAASLAFPVYKIYDEITRAVMVEFDDFTQEIDDLIKNNIFNSSSPGFTGKFQGIVEEVQLEEVLEDPQLLQNLALSRNIIQNIMNRGVIFTDEAFSIPPSGIMEIWREMGDDFDKTIVKYNQIPRKETLSLYIRNELKAENLPQTDLRTIEVFAVFFIRENCFLDEFNSRLSRDQAVSRVKPVEIFMDKGELILEKGLVVTPEIEAKLLAIKNIKGSNNFLSFVSPFLFAAFLFIFGIIYFNIFSPKFASNTQLDILFFSILTISILVAYIIILFISLPNHLSHVVFIPIALFSMLVTLLSDKKSG